MILNFQSNLIAIIILAFAIVSTCIPAGNANSAEEGVCNPVFENDPRYGEFKVAIEKLYGEIGLDKKIDQEIFELSMIGYYNLKKKNLLQKDTAITIIDYRKPSTVERLYVIDLESRNLVVLLLSGPWEEHRR